MPSGEHPLFEVPWEDLEWRDGRGLVCRHTVELEDAPSFCVPWRFDANFDEPVYPVVITLKIADCTLRKVVLTPRLDRTPELLHVDDGSAWQRGRAPYLNVGSVPEMPLPLFFRDALARVAMPRDRPFVSELNRHAVEVAAALPIKRAARTSHHEMAVMRAAYREARSDPELSTKYAVRERVFNVLHEAFPERWPQGDGKTPDYDRLRPFLTELERDEAPEAMTTR